MLDDEVRRIVEQSHTDALTLLRENRDRLDALANALLDHETLGEDEAYALQAFPSRARRQESSQPPLSAPRRTLRVCNSRAVTSRGSRRPS